VIRVLKLVTALQVHASAALADFRRQEGQTMAEYGVVLAVITLVVVVAITALSGRIGNAIDAVTAILPKG
jgi:Flp pilus assembly pilin Flp